MIILAILLKVSTAKSESVVDILAAFIIRLIGKVSEEINIIWIIFMKLGAVL